MSGDAALRRGEGVDISPLKRWAEGNLPPKSLLRMLIVSQSDVVPNEDFPAKVGEWLRLLELESCG
jgi:hypothetical protein